MKVLVTGAAGYIGRAVVHELVSHGHKVMGLVRNDTSARIVQQLGAEDLRGDIEDISSLTSAAKGVDGIIHLAFTMDFSDFPRACAIDRAAIRALAQGLNGADKPLVITSGTLLLPTGQIATEDTEPDLKGFLAVRAESEDLVKAISKDALVRGSVVRLAPVVHDVEDKGFVTMLGDIARKNGAVAYIDQGQSLWPAVHRLDAAVLYRLVLEKGTTGSVYHGVAEQGIQMKPIMETIGEKIDLPAVSKSQADVDKSLGFFGHIIGIDNPVSSAKTQAELRWNPQQVGLLSDIQSNYFPRP